MSVQVHVSLYTTINIYARKKWENEKNKENFENVIEYTMHNVYNYANEKVLFFERKWVYTNVQQFTVKWKKQKGDRSD